MGIKNLKKMNVSLLCKWWWALEKEEGLWQDLVKLKYVKNLPTCAIHNRLSDSTIWSDLLKVRHIYLKDGEIKIKNAKYISFWLDSWLENSPLCQVYPILYDLTLNKNCSVAEVKEKGWVVQFRIRLQGLLRDQWYEMAAKLNRVSLCAKPDTVSWKWTVNRDFLVKSVYEHLTKDDSGSSYKRIWKAKIPAKIKTFMWLIEQGAILTKDNMLRRNWHEDPSCYFCKLPESMDHLFFECPVAKVIWGTVAICLAQDNRPNSYRQFWQWIPKALPSGEKFHMFGVSAICWAIWKCRNKVCFEKKA
jgi:hypothetical protein